MNKISIVIPFFQREIGILTRAVTSVKSQRLPEGWSIELIVVDDGSPKPARNEIDEIDFGGLLRLRVIRQANQGVAAARNTGLQYADGSCCLRAFLDSDDIWPPDHLLRAIRAIEQGFDFYFTDNRRVDRHESYCRLSPYATKTAAFIESSAKKSGLLEIPKDLMIGLTLTEFPCHTSTVVYRRGIAEILRFDTDLRYTGEDILFFTTLASSADKICLDLDSFVVCGRGVNIYFSNLTAETDKFLSIKVDKFVAHHRLAGRLDLSPINKKWNDQWVAISREDLTFHLMRGVLTKPVRTLWELVRLSHMAPRAAVALPREMLYFMCKRVAKCLWKLAKTDRRDTQ